MPGLSSHEKSFTKMRQQFLSDLPDQRPSLVRRYVAPALSRFLQAQVKLLQNIVLKTPFLAGINFKFNPLFRPQTTSNKKMKRTRRKLFQTADRSAQFGAVKAVHQTR